MFLGGVKSGGEEGKKKPHVNKQKRSDPGQFVPKTDDTRSLVEYSTSGICLTANEACSIFQRQERRHVEEKGTW